jgi:hypothetical protein
MLPDGDDGVAAARFLGPAMLFANECGVGNIVWSVVFAVNTDTAPAQRSRNSLMWMPSCSWFAQALRIWNGLHR